MLVLDARGRRVLEVEELVVVPVARAHVEVAVARVHVGAQAEIRDDLEGDVGSAGEPKRWRLTNLLLLLGPLLLPDADSLDLRLLARGGVGLRERGDDVGSDQDVEDQDGDDGGDRVAVVGAGTLEVSREDKPRTRR